MSTLHILNARLLEEPNLAQSLYIKDGRFVDKLPEGVECLDLKGRLVLPGLIETHLHLDKACILHRCNLHEGTLSEAIAQTASAKAEFTEDDVYLRAAKVLEMAIVKGTTHIRTHVEIDPVIGLTGFHAIQRLQRDYAWAVGLEICVFPQEGMLNNPGTESLLLEALEEGADLLGGCPYTDSDPDAQIARLFDIAVARDIDLDFHLDFDLDASWLRLTEVCRQTRMHNWQGRVTIGHVTKLSMLPPDQLNEVAGNIADSGVQVTVLPSTDLFLSARDVSHAVPRGVAPLMPLHKRGVTCSISSNNIGNPFTPYGDASLVRQANLYANVSQLATSDELTQCLAWVSTESARLIGLKDYGLSAGSWADFIVLDAESPATVIAEIAQPLMGFKRGRQTFKQEKARLLNVPK
jgi:cytosine deaminase